MPNITTLDTTTIASSIGANSNFYFPCTSYRSSASRSASGFNKIRYSSLSQDISSLIHTATDVGASPSTSVSVFTWTEIPRPTALRSSLNIPGQRARRASSSSSAGSSATVSLISTSSPSAGPTRDPRVPLSSDGITAGINRVSTATSISTALLQTTPTNASGLDENRTDTTSGVGASPVSSDSGASNNPRIMTSTTTTDAWETSVAVTLISSSASSQKTSSADPRDLALPSHSSTPPSSSSRTTLSGVQPSNAESSDLLTFSFSYGVTPGPLTSSRKMSAISSAPELPTTPSTLTSLSLSTTDGEFCSV